MTAFLVWLWPHLWPGWDSLWPNILASILCGAVVWLWGRRKFRQLHARHDELVEHVQRIHDHLGIGQDGDARELP